MPSGSDWLDQILSKINGLENRLGQKEYRDLRLDFLAALAQRIDQFAGSCTKCTVFQQDVDSLIACLDGVTENDDKALRKSRIRDTEKSIGNMTAHLKKQHRLIDDGDYIVGCTLLGGAIAAQIYMLTLFIIISHQTWPFEYLFLSIGIGAGVGIVVGAIIENKAQKEDRILRTKVNGKLRPFWIRLFFWVLVMAGLAAIAFLSNEFFG